MIGVSVSTLQNWEQGRRRPEGPARALLKIASENPETVGAVVKRLSNHSTLPLATHPLTPCPRLRRLGTFAQPLRGSGALKR